MAESLRDIRIFVAAYEERSFTAAAVREHATQSGVSQHIRKLEEGFRVKLFNREKGQVAPTPAADAYYSRCIQILRNIESSNNAMRAFTGISGEVFVGLMPTMTRATLAPAIQRVVGEHPNMKIHVTESYSPILIQKVMAAELDFAVVPAFMGSRGLKVEHFLRTWETLVASPDKKMHLRRTRLRDVGPLKIVLPSHANARRKPLETYFTTNGVDIERIVEMDAMMGTLDLVSKSDWVTIIPALMMTAEIERMQFSVVPLVDPTAPLDLVVIEPMRRTRLRDVGPLKIVLPSHANARRKPLETYFTTNGVDIERIVEMDAMMGTLDLVSKSDWVTIIPALMMTAEIERMQFSVVPLVDPTAPLDLVVIEPMRRTLSAAARAFLEILRAEAVGLNNLWRQYFD